MKYTIEQVEGVTQKPYTTPAAKKVESCRNLFEYNNVYLQCMTKWSLRVFGSVSANFMRQKGMEWTNVELAKASWVKA